MNTNGNAVRELSAIDTQLLDIFEKARSQDEATSYKHILPDDENFDQYLDHLISDINSRITTGEISLDLACVGMTYDDNEEFMSSIYDFDKVMRILTSKGICPVCASNYIDYFMRQEKFDNGQLKNIFMISQFDLEMDWMRDEYIEHICKYDSTAA